MALLHNSQNNTVVGLDCNHPGNDSSVGHQLQIFGNSSTAIHSHDLLVLQTEKTSSTTPKVPTALEEHLQGKSWR